MNKTLFIIRSITYVILLSVIISCMFAPYWARSGAVCANIVCALVWSILGLLVQQAPTYGISHKIIHRRETILHRVLALIVILPAIFVPCLWYLGRFEGVVASSYLEETILVAFICSQFVILALELQILLNNHISCIYTSPHRIIIIALICIFGRWYRLSSRRL